MGSLLIFEAPTLPFGWLANVLAALVLLEVSAVKVVEALNTVPANEHADNARTHNNSLNWWYTRTQSSRSLAAGDGVPPISEIQRGFSLKRKLIFLI
jgi:hypothetical protein